MDNHTGGGYTDNNDGGLETRKFFLNCLCLLLGRLDSKRFEPSIFPTTSTLALCGGMNPSCYGEKGKVGSYKGKAQGH